MVQLECKLSNENLVYNLSSILWLIYNTTNKSKRGRLGKRREEMGRHSEPLIKDAWGSGPDGPVDRGETQTGYLSWSFTSPLNLINKGFRERRTDQPSQTRGRLVWENVSVSRTPKVLGLREQNGEVRVPTTTEE